MPIVADRIGVVINVEKQDVAHENSNGGWVQEP
jgi:hypothetical protein